MLTLEWNPDTDDRDETPPAPKTEMPGTSNGVITDAEYWRAVDRVRERQVMPSADRNTHAEVKLIGRLGTIGIPVYTDGEFLCVGNSNEFQAPGELFAEVGKGLARKVRKMAREAGYAHLAAQSAVELVA